MRKEVLLVLVLLLVPVVYAVNGCCGETVTGESCRYTSEENCATMDYFNEDALCEDTSFCGTGCCVSSSGCFEGDGEYTCALDSGEFFNEQSCGEIDSCQSVCCQVGSDYNFLTEMECQSQIDSLGSENVVMSYVSSESECQEMEDSNILGCCVTQEGCSYINNGGCDLGNFDSEGFGFYSNEFCSDVVSYLTENSLSASDYCECEPSGNSCDEDLMNIVEKDSCGNTGRVVQECNYPDEVCMLDSNGEAYCGGTSCTFELPENLKPFNPLWEDNMDNYEAQCLYESPAGNYQDVPGSRHYVINCIAGEIALEPCSDYREEVCIRNEVSAGFNQDKCTANTVASEGNVTTVPVGQDRVDVPEETTTDSCSTSVVNCEVTFGKSGIDGAYECDANCFCLRKEWSKLMNEYCKAQGDCGNDVNLLGVLSEDSFEMTRSRESVGVKHFTEVGCGELCVDGSSNIADARGLQCYPGGSLATCTFYVWDMFDDSYNGNLNYEQDLVLRVTEPVSYFTFLEYAGITPEFFSVATEHDLSGSSTYSSIAYYDLLGVFFDYSLTDYIDSETTCDSENRYWDQQFYMVYNPESTWESTIVNSRDYCGLTSVPFIEYEYIIGQKVIINDITEDYARAIEYENKDTRQEVVVSSVCSAWQPPSEGSCELCDVPITDGGIALSDVNGNVLYGYTCSKYRCESLGKNCQSVDGTEGTGRPSCISVETETSAPIISVWDEVMQDENYVYTTSSNSVVATEVPVGHNHFPVITDDYTRCKLTDDPNVLYLQENIALEGLDLYTGLSSIMEDPVGGWSKEHNFTYNSLNEGNTEYDLYVYCINYNNVFQIEFFNFKYTTTDKPDTDYPTIEGSVPASGALVPANDNSVYMSLYLDEYASCSYSNTPITEYSGATLEFPSCSASESLFEVECGMEVPLNTGMTEMYIYCKDQVGNVNLDPYYWAVSKSEPLLITQTSPYGTVYTNDVVLQVNTGSGVDNGNAVCSYQGGVSTMQEMYITSGTYHEQSLSLEKGSYSYDISCVDSIGNVNNTVISFTVDKDESAASITGIYYLGSNVYVLTNEASNCQYALSDFSYGAGSSMGGTASTAHSFTVSIESTYYVSCVDGYGNIMDTAVVDLRYLFA